MTRIRRNLGLLLALSLSTVSAYAQQEDFDQGIDLLRRGRKEEALAAFKRVIASGLSNQDAYELWASSDDSSVWVDMMVEGGEYDLVARRFLELAKLGRKERLNDEDAIRGLVGELRSTEDALERRRLTRQLSADHGEYAVPFLLGGLGEGADDEWRVTAMTALQNMDHAVVLPLMAALGSDNSYLRRNVAMTLGNIGDPRAAGLLQALSQDSDSSVASAASTAAVACGATGSAIDQLLRIGDDYHNRRASVLRPYQQSDVVWAWANGALESTAVPAALYNNMLSKQAYETALAVDPGSLNALAGIARAYVDMDAKITALEEAGVDVSDLSAEREQAALAVRVAGVEALDRALQWAVRDDDTATGTRLCAALAEAASEPTPGLLGAVEHSEGSLQGEAAVALASTSWRAGLPADAFVVGRLSEAVGREILRIVAVVDGDAGRAGGIARGLSGRDVMVNHRGTGGSGIVMLHSLPGVDAILLGDGLPDMTLDQILADIEGNEALAETPVYLVTGNSEVSDLYGERVDGTLSGSDDLSALDEVFEARLTGDRARAAVLAERAATALAHLAQAGQSDLASASDALTSNLATRADAVALPAMRALGAAGGAGAVDSLMGIVSDSAKSDEVRVAAADALGGIFARAGLGGQSGVALRDLLSSDSSVEVKRAAARALGRLQLAGSDRAALISAAASLSE